MQLPLAEQEMEQPRMTPAEFRELAILELMQMVELITINRGCIHGRLETALAKPAQLGGRPFLGPRLGPCNGDCLFCMARGKRRDVFRPVFCSSLVCILVRGFSTRERMQLYSDLVDFLWNSNDISKSVYDLSSSSLYKRHVEGTVLQLLGSRMLKPVVRWNSEEESYITHVKLAHTDNMAHVTVDRSQHLEGLFYCQLDDAWDGIETKQASGNPAEAGSAT
mmetsp:Transcript_48503/g.89986  ORF Transcript_48503/g.89986 Transcript_48503/m.89986 type:complete len:222 (-) Transcript_48503:3152-3817(-)